MKSITMNINVNFTYENICSILFKFWMNYVIISNKKIWLTICVTNINNISFTLIKNLPFNTSDYLDVFTVLKQKFEGEIMHNKRDKLSSITFSYYFDSKNNIYTYIDIDNCDYILFICFFTIMFFNVLLLIVLIIFDIIYINIDTVNEFEYIPPKFVKSNISINLKQNINNSIFTIFIDLFNTKSSIKYFPSYFVPEHIKCENNNICILEYIYAHKFNILDYINNQNSLELINNEYANNLEVLNSELLSLIKEYSSTIKWIVNNNPLECNT